MSLPLSVWFEWTVFLAVNMGVVYLHISSVYSLWNVSTITSCNTELDVYFAHTQIALNTWQILYQR
jgi:hypothetical protein